ncbi:MAG: PIN domain-containing protein [Candidatus Pacearchaeota archaeon]
MNTLVIDSNIIISALIKEGITRNILTNLNMNFLFPEFGLEEIYSNKLEIIKKAGITSRQFDVLLLRLLKYIRLIPLDFIVNYKEEADKIMNEIHKEDSVFIATALAFKCPIWSDDKHFKKQKEIKIFTTKDTIDLSK